MIVLGVKQLNNFLSSQGLNTITGDEIQIASVQMDIDENGKSLFLDVVSAQDVENLFILSEQTKRELYSEVTSFKEDDDLFEC